jgi:hypothetical protein
MPGTVNPYAGPREARKPGEAPGASTAMPPHWAYAVPDIPESTDPENTDGGYSPVLRVTGASGTLPDAIRVGAVEPPENDPNVREYNARRTAEFHQRHSDEATYGTWDVRQSQPYVPPIPDQVQEKLPVRRTAVRSPLGYLFTRPWHIPRTVHAIFGGDPVDHVSLADHRRDYEIYGMAPQGRLGANTFRKDPTPWDRFLTVQPNEQPVEALQRESISTGRRTYRLGG